MAKIEEIAYMNHLQSMNHMDRLAAIQKKANRIEQIRKMHRAAKEKAHQVTHAFSFCYTVQIRMTIPYNTTTTTI